MFEESFLLESPAEESLITDNESIIVPEPELAEPATGSIAEPGFVCASEKWMHSACKGQPFYRTAAGKPYCVLHYPGDEKVADFRPVLRRKLQAGDFNFRGVWFPEDANFNGVKFRTTAYFGFANFRAAAYFRRATFNARADFIGARFSGVAYFRFARFKDQVNFYGNQSFSDESVLDLQSARIDRPELIIFHTMTLRPHWFVNADPRKFAFADVKWNWPAPSPTGEIKSLEPDQHVSSPRQLLAIACGQLAENAEANNRYEEASHFRYWAMNLRRQQKWAGRKFWKTDWLHILYWVVSGYGERMLRAFAWLVALWVVFALLYTRVGFTKPEDKSAAPTADPTTATEPDTVGQPLPLKRAFTYSLGVMSLQKPEPTPLTGTAQTLVLLETILGPLQAALLALAIRRKFMR